MSDESALPGPRPSASASRSEPQSKATAKSAAGPVAVRCPVCALEFDTTHSRSLPFCSPRCKVVDLGRWLGEEHGLPLERAEEDELPWDEQ